MSNNARTIWPTFLYADAPAAIEFLQSAFGFESTLVVPNDNDPAVIEHAQLRWPEAAHVLPEPTGTGGIVRHEAPV